MPKHLDEEVHLAIATAPAARRDLSRNCGYYDGERLHLALDERTPTEIYLGVPLVDGTR